MSEDCLSHKDMRHLFNKPDSWQEWIVSQIEEEGVEQYKQWYARMFERGVICEGLCEAHNYMFGDK